MLWIFKNDPIFKNSVKPRPVEEILNIQIFRPLAHILLIAIKDTKIKPETIVITHTFLVLSASVLIFYSQSLILDLIAFLKLQLKTILDNLDGQLARYKNQQSTLGRYLDTLMDYLGNLFLFTVIGIKHNLLPLSLISFYTLTIVLSYDYNLERLYKEKNKKSDTLQFNNNEHNNLCKLLSKLYEFLLGYQDKSIYWLEENIFKKIDKTNKYTHVFWNKNYLNLTVNMGLTTQLFILGILILLNKESLYLYFPFICLLLIKLMLVYRIIVTYKEVRKHGKNSNNS
ncbi:MAG: CDP-alcohol phosphatidyltransferase family protein [bacterium]